MKNSNYCFFYDESFHDRKITFKNNEVNILKKDLSDIFVGTFVGVKVESIEKFENEYIQFENKYKEIFQIEGELKGGIIKKKNFEFGFNSLNINSINFYTDFFELMYKNNCIFQLNLFSKIEFLVLKSFNKISYNKQEVNFKKEAFLYSIIKFINNYDNFKIPKDLFKEGGTLKSEQIIRNLKKSLITISKKISKINRKIEEKRTLEEIIDILNNIDLEIIQNEKICWDYDRLFIGLNLLIEEMNLKSSDVEVKLDKEQNTLEAGRRIGNYKKIENYDSMNIIGIRCADILGNFFGRLIDSIQKELKEDNSNKISDERKLISRKWFILNKSQFNLVKIIGKLFDIQYHYSTYVSLYFDFQAVIFSYIHYINQFKNYNEYKYREDKYENGNEYILQVLRDKINQLK